eukprot:TRINITY_DN12634_c0_g1_i2.p3 TRINITY_DN12634_c0_g1~~TRINITY_DN12634_c0_g1_i2.p3  ORF type:complete len:224 (+),score=69.58 TRINITY_DN12634_c0_g1_i2:480-1151(+)
MEYLEASENDFKSLYANLKPIEIKYYFYEMLKVIDYANSKGIMHRDIKPQNVIIDNQNKKLKVIDWGLAEFYHPGMEYNVRVASRYYKAPELLLDYKYYDYSMDMWSIGCMLASIIFQQDPFFAGKDNSDQLLKIVKVIGTDELYDYLKKYGTPVNPHFVEHIGKHSKKPWKKLRTPQNEAYATNEAIDLVSRLLLIDHAKRLTAREAMAHSYFAELRKEDKI